MKNFLKSVILCSMVLGLGLSFSGISLAHEGNKEAFTKLLNDSAAALQASRPDLATELTKWSTEEANEKEEKDEKKEMEGKTEQEMHANRAAHLKLLKDSAAALQVANPGLAAELTKTAEKKANWTPKKKEGK